VKFTPSIAAILILCCSAIAADVAAPAAANPLDVGQLIEKVGIIGVLGGAVFYLQRRNEASEKRSQDFAERALSTLATSTAAIGEITEALAALNLAIAAETEETREMRKAIQESGRTMARTQA
jgi:hypothetical protein